MISDMRHLIRLVEEASTSQTESNATGTWAYHGTLQRALRSIASGGLQSSRRPKWSEDGSSRRMFNLLYFSLDGPDGWGKAHPDYVGETDLVELRFPLIALKKIKWQEDEQREDRDEYYAVSRNEFSILPEFIEVLDDGKWMLLSDYMRDIF